MIFRGLAASIGTFAALGLAGCSMSGGPGDMMVDPGHYSSYHCKELADRSKVLAQRQKELQNLIAKANESGGGAVIGTLAYRPEYESVLTEEKLVQREAVEKKCDFSVAPAYTSDQTIR